MEMRNRKGWRLVCLGWKSKVEEEGRGRGVMASPAITPANWPRELPLDVTFDRKSFFG